jgi:peptide/nickel transport system substrate-binding protein
VSRKLVALTADEDELASVIAHEAVVSWAIDQDERFRSLWFLPVANPATRVAALLAGDLDMIYPVPQQDIQRLSQAAGVRIQQGATARTVYLAFDMFRQESLDMPGTGRNPFRDVRVRRAFYQAIDMETIRRVVMRNSSRNSALIIAPQVGGYQADLDTRLPFDPDRAKALLAEAGYPNGFPVTLACPNNRYVNDEAICTAIIPMLTRIGVQARLVTRPMNQHINTAGSPNFEASFWMLGWTPGNFDVFSPIRELLTTTDGAGTFNWGRYNNPRLEALRPLLEDVYSTLHARAV